MTLSVKKVVAEVFPDEFVEEIMRELTRFGKGPGHSRSVPAYVYIVRRSNGDRRELHRLVNDAIADLPLFMAFAGVWKQWMRGSTISHSGLGRFWEPILRESADLALERQFRVHYSHGALVMRPPTNATDTRWVFVVPQPLERLLICRSFETASWRYPDEATLPADEGQFFGRDQAVTAIVEAVHKTFKEPRRA